MVADGRRVGARSRASRLAALGLLLCGGLLLWATPCAAATDHRTPAQLDAASGASAVWLCRPGSREDPCASSLATTVIPASGATKVVTVQDDASSPFDCFYLYPTVSTQKSTNANLKIQKSEIEAAVYEASRFSTVCKLWAPIYHQVTVAGLTAGPDLRVPQAAETEAYDSVKSAFEEYLSQDNDGRPVVFIGHSQGAAMLILLLRHLVDDDPAIRARMVIAIILGGNVEVKPGSHLGGTFSNLPDCTSSGEAGCVIAYSTFPGTPPSDSLFGRPGQGISLQSGQTARSGLQVACVNPAALGGGSAPLLSYFPPTAGVSTPWVEYPDRYTARCEHADGATWLDIEGDGSPSDHRPTVSEISGPKWGYHAFDDALAMGNLVTDVAAAEATWSAHHASAG